MNPLVTSSLGIAAVALVGTVLLPVHCHAWWSVPLVTNSTHSHLTNDGKTAIADWTGLSTAR